MKYFLRSLLSAPQLSVKFQVRMYKIYLYRHILFYFLIEQQQGLNRFAAEVSLVISHTFGCYTPEIIPHIFLVATENSVGLFISVELAELRTDEKNLTDICSSHFWEFLNEVNKRWPCLFYSFNKVLY